MISKGCESIGFARFGGDDDALTEITRKQYARDGAGYASDLRDDEWRLIAPKLPAPRPLAARAGGPARGDERHSLSCFGGLRVALAADFPPLSTVQGYFYAWRDSGLLRAINNSGPIMDARQKAGKEASPTAGIHR